MRMLTVCLALLCTGCAILEEGLPFEPIGNLKTSHREGLSEGGHGEAWMPPSGLTFSSRVVGIRNPRTDIPQPCYRWTVLMVDQRDPQTGAVMPRFESARLVDDEGRTFQAGRLTQKMATRSDDGASSIREWTLDFPVPQDYRFNQIGRTTIHWVLAMDGAEPVAISSRFRQ